jgi:predicted mannosyl-3-phosphoglycerate phosphatase (HAD superfamily)
MMQRHSFFPDVKFWICENGGCIFEKSDDGSLQELHEYRETFFNQDSYMLLQDFKQELECEGWIVDSNGYESMIRVKGDKLQRLVVPRIPVGLDHTFNLGYLDIHLPKTGKKSALQWLLTTYYGPRHGGYYFMGDDDNDIEVAAGSDECFIVADCSEGMKAWSTSRSSKSTVLNIGRERQHAGTISLLGKVLERLKSDSQSSKRE